MIDYETGFDDGFEHANSDNRVGKSAQEIGLEIWCIRQELQEIRKEQDAQREETHELIESQLQTLKVLQKLARVLDYCTARVDQIWKEAGGE